MFNERHKVLNGEDKDIQLIHTKVLNELYKVNAEALENRNDD